MVMKIFRFFRYRREYWQELVRAPYFWLSVVLLILGIVLGQLKLVNWIIQLILLIAGFFLLFGMKQRILGRLEERHFKGK